MPSLIPEITNTHGTHVLIIGVSDYDHVEGGSGEITSTAEAFEIGQLTAASASASEFANWILNSYHYPNAPLSSLRILLSPSKNEIVHQSLDQYIPEIKKATLNNAVTALKEFKKVALKFRDNRLIVYFAGHGLNITKTSASLLLSDFGSPNQSFMLENTLSIGDLHGGLNSDKAPKTQFWFVDLCRQNSSVANHFETINLGYGWDSNKRETEASLIIYAATYGNKAYARIGGKTLFLEALLTCLKGYAISAPDVRAINPDVNFKKWHVSVSSLISTLKDHVEALAKQEGTKQQADFDGKIQNVVFQVFKSIPKVGLTIKINPKQAETESYASLSKVDGKVVFSNSVSWPIIQTIEAGTYKININTNPPYKAVERLSNFFPPESLILFEMENE